MLKGFKTLLINGALAGVAGFLHYVVGADLSAVDPSIAIIVVAVANMGLRLVTTTPVLKGK